MVNWDIKTGWKGLRDSFPKIILPTDKWDDTVWFYRNLLGCRQLKPFGKSGDRNVFTELELGSNDSTSLSLLIVETQFYQQEILQGKTAIEGGKQILNITLPDETFIGSLIDILTERGYGPDLDVVQPDPAGPKFLLVHDPNGNLLIFTTISN